MLVLSSQARVLGSNPVVWLCDQEPVCTLQKDPQSEKAKLRHWWTYLSQIRLMVHHIQGVKNEGADYISRNNFDALIGARSEALAKEAFSRTDVHLDLNMTMIRPPDGLQQAEYLKEFGDIYKRLEKRLEPLHVSQEQWKRDKSYLLHEDRIVVPSDRVPALLKWTHESSGHVGADRTLRLFKQWFHTTWTDDLLPKTLQPIVDKCPCRSCKPGDIRERGLYSTLPIPHCANTVLYVDYTEMRKFEGYDFALVGTCGLTRFTRVFPCTKDITREETIKILLEEGTGRARRGTGREPRCRGQGEERWVSGRARAWGTGGGKRGTGRGLERGPRARARAPRAPRDRRDRAWEPRGEGGTKGGGRGAGRPRSWTCSR